MEEKQQNRLLTCVLFAFFAVLLFSRTPAMVLVGLMGTGLFMATIYPSAFAFGSDCIRGNDFGCSVMILTGSQGAITPAPPSASTTSRGFTRSFYAAGKTASRYTAGGSYPACPAA